MAVRPPPSFAWHIAQWSAKWARASASTSERKGTGFFASRALAGTARARTRLAGIGFRIWSDVSRVAPDVSAVSCYFETLTRLRPIIDRSGDVRLVHTARRSPVATRTVNGWDAGSLPLKSCGRAKTPPGDTRLMET